jgi:hypothetical protein
MPQVCSSPAASCVNSPGGGEDCPLVFHPQQTGVPKVTPVPVRALPAENSAQPCCPPVAMAPVEYAQAAGAGPPSTPQTIEQAMARFRRFIQPPRLRKRRPTSSLRRRLVTIGYRRSPAKTTRLMKGQAAPPSGDLAFASNGLVAG